MKILFIPFLLLFLSCSSSKVVQNSNDSSSKIVKETEEIVLENNRKNHTIEIAVKTHIPYCGGAYPREEQLNKYSIGANSYLLINLATNKKHKITSDTSGILYLNLNKGTYAIRELYKNMSFLDFQNNNKAPSDQFSPAPNKDCYKEWWKSNLLEFKVKDANKITKHEIIITSMCRKGKNPCIIYTGHLPK